VALLAITGVFTLVGITLLGDLRRKAAHSPELEAIKAQNIMIQDGLALVQQTLLAAMGKAK
jgi:hypothetical protein